MCGLFVTPVSEHCITVWNDWWLTVKCVATVERVGQERLKQLK